MVHERFTGAEIAGYRRGHGADPGHRPSQCPPDVLAEADYVGSTHGMINWVTTNQPDRVMMLTECSMADNVPSRGPGHRVRASVQLFPHMKRITLENIRTSLATLTHLVEVAPEIAEQARVVVFRMLEVGRQG